MASIFDIFTKPSAPATPAPATPAPATPAPSAPLPAATETPPVAAPTTPAPLDQFTKLWETEVPSGEQPDTSLFGTVDPKKIFEAAKGANFAGAIPQETLAAIQSGGDGAVKALQDALNHVTQAVFAQNTLASTKLIEQAVGKAMAQQLEQLPGLVKRHAAADTLQAKNPALSNPAAAPIINAIQAQLAIKHPGATASQLTQMAEDYLNNFAEVVKPTAKPKEASAPEAGFDWSKFLSS